MVVLASFTGDNLFFFHCVCFLMELVSYAEEDGFTTCDQSVVYNTFKLCEVKAHTLIHVEEI